MTTPDTPQADGIRAALEAEVMRLFDEYHFGHDDTMKRHTDRILTALTPYLAPVVVPASPSWAENAAREMVELSQTMAVEYPTEFKAGCLAIILRHAPANQAGREDTELLDWLEKHAKELFRNEAEDAKGEWFVVVQTAPVSMDKPLGEFRCFDGVGVRSAIRAALQQKEGM